MVSVEESHLGSLLDGKGHKLNLPPDLRMHEEDTIGSKYSIKMGSRGKSEWLGLLTTSYQGLGQIHGSRA